MGDLIVGLLVYLEGMLFIARNDFFALCFIIWMTTIFSNILQTIEVSDMGL